MTKKLLSMTRMVFFLLSFVCFTASSLLAATYYVDRQGSDSADGHTAPWLTIKHALTQVKAGDVISINDGVYSEGQLVFPEGVSLTSTSQDNTKVKIQPNIRLGLNKPLLILSSASPGSNGNQTISYVELDGQNGSNTCRWAIKLQNRNNVRIHHCNIHDFFCGNASYAVWVKSTEIPFTSKWWEFCPYNQQEPGNDINLDALWPANPITNFELDHNTITKCGYRKSLGSGSFCNTIELFNLKDSSIHDNDIDSINAKSQCIVGVSAILDNVDIYNNTLRMARYTDRSSYIIEIWNLRGGCEIFNNNANSCFSICIGKETKIYDNDIVLDPPSSEGGNIGIEFTLQTYGEVYNNYVEGANIWGITTGITIYQNGYLQENTVLRNNIIYNVGGAGICITGEGSGGTSDGIKVLNNTIDTNRSDAGFGLIRLKQEETAVLKNVDVINNICLNAQTYPGVTVGMVSSLIITNNLFWNSGTNAWYNGDDINTVIADPVFVAMGDRPDYYQIQAGSNARDAGTNSVSGTVTDDFWGNERPVNLIYDIGAHEYGFLFSSNNDYLMIMGM